MCLIFRNRLLLIYIFFLLFYLISQFLQKLFTQGYVTSILKQSLQIFCVITNQLIVMKNIHFQTAKWNFPRLSKFNVYPLSQTRLLQDLTIRITRTFSHKKQKLLSLCELLISLLGFGGSVLFIFLDFCVGFFFFACLRNMFCARCYMCLQVVYS